MEGESTHQRLFEIFADGVADIQLNRITVSSLNHDGQVQLLNGNPDLLGLLR